MPPLHCHVLGFRPVPPQCRFAWPFVRRFGISSPVGLSSPVIIAFFIPLCCNPVPWGGGPCSACCYFLMYAATATAHQLHIAACMRLSGILSLGVVFPVLLRVVSSCMRSQPASCIAPAFFAYGIPVYVHFYVSFWFILSNLRPPVVCVCVCYERTLSRNCEIMMNT